jgi:Leucine-rich repeat (LRR) protein
VTVGYSNGLQTASETASLSGIGYDPCGSDINIPDSNLLVRIRATTGVLSGPISGADAAGVTSLSGIKQNISDLTGLECFTNLTYLSLAINTITDISPLAGLTKLNELVLGSNQQLSNISALAGLTNLVTLNLVDCNLSNISVLQGLTNLDSLDISSNEGVTSIDPLYGNLGLGSGDYVNISGTAIDCSEYNLFQLINRGVDVYSDCD